MSQRHLANHIRMIAQSQIWKGGDPLHYGARQFPWTNFTDLRGIDEIAVLNDVKVPPPDVGRSSGLRQLTVRVLADDFIQISCTDSAHRDCTDAGLSKPGILWNFGLFILWRFIMGHPCLQKAWNHVLDFLGLHNVLEQLHAWTESFELAFLVEAIKFWHTKWVSLGLIVQVVLN